MGHISEILSKEATKPAMRPKRPPENGATATPDLLIDHTAEDLHTRMRQHHTPHASEQVRSCT